MRINYTTFILIDLIHHHTRHFMAFLQCGDIFQNYDLLGGLRLYFAHLFDFLPLCAT